MSFPEHSESPPSKPQAGPPQAPVSVTLAIFDSSLSRRTRLTAIFSSLAINLFLPFVNGVMLGFGEIFAKNVVLQMVRMEADRPCFDGHECGTQSISRGKATTIQIAYPTPTMTSYATLMHTSATTITYLI